MKIPKLIILVGLPGSGKSTYAQKLKRQNNDNMIILSSDALRKELFGDETVQTQNNELFQEMQKRTFNFLNQGKTVIYDATNITRKSRASIIKICPKFAQIEAHIIWAPIETCIERDNKRKRTVGKDVIDSMVKRFQAPYYDEGINFIHIEMSKDFDCYAYSMEVWKNMNIPHDNPNHTHHIQKHCELAEEYAHNQNWESDIRLALLAHDCGKPYTKAFVNGKGEETEIAHYYQHQCVGAWISYGLGYNTYVAWLISTHMDPMLDTTYYKNMPEFLKQGIDKLHEADLVAH